MEQKTVDSIVKMIRDDKSMTESEASKILRAISEKGLIRGSHIIWYSDIWEAARMAALHAGVSGEDFPDVMRKVTSRMDGESYIEEHAYEIEKTMQEEADFLAEWEVTHGSRERDSRRKEERGER